MVLILASFKNHLKINLLQLFFFKNSFKFTEKLCRKYTEFLYIIPFPRFSHCWHLALVLHISNILLKYVLGKLNIKD